MIFDSGILNDEDPSAKKDLWEEAFPSPNPMEESVNIRDIVRAWKDSEYRESLSEEQRSLLPEMPIGNALSNEELLSITGGAGNAHPDIIVSETQATNDQVVTFCFPRCSPL